MFYSIKIVCVIAMMISIFYTKRNYLNRPSRITSFLSNDKSNDDVETYIMPALWQQCLHINVAPRKSYLYILLLLCGDLEQLPGPKFETNLKEYFNTKGI